MEKNDDIIFDYFKNEWIYIETLINTYSNLNVIQSSDQTKFTLNKINKIKDYFNFEIQERNAMGKILSKHIAVFDYIDKTLFVLSATKAGISIISFTSVIGAPVGIISASFSLMFSLTIGIINKLLKITRNKKAKHNKVVMLAKSKLNIFETLISQALIDLENSHE